tara:strand:- start:928 stop:1815 length:888 start_codon:yes stop_codon:yes gene_type:complete
MFILNEKEQAIVLQFGEPKKTYTNAGLHFKVPFIQQVLRFDKRLLEWDGAATEMPTNDNKYILIDAFARWMINDPLQFYKSAKNESMAQSRLDDIIDGILRDEISKYVMVEIIRSSEREMVIYDEEIMDDTMLEGLDQNQEEASGKREQIVASILKKVQSKLLDLNMGIEVKDIQLKRINNTEDVQNKIFRRMISGQNRIAEKYRAQGQGTKLDIVGQTDQKKKEILSEAYYAMKRIRGAADSLATRIYADAYGKDPDFFKFINTLKTYEQTIDSTSQIIFSTDGEYFKFLKTSQ